MRERTGSIIKRDGKVYARVTYVGSDGKRHALWRGADNKTAAKAKIRELQRQLDDHGEQGMEGEKLTFHQLAQVYEQRKLVPAEYHGERKVRGLRSYQTPRGYLRTLRQYFGSRHIRSITHSDIEEYKQARLKTPVKEANECKQRSIAGVNRELELLRAVLRFALRQGWLARSPFEMGAPIISKADEARRERVLTHEEEIRLLAACKDRRAHLKPILIAALDTAARRGELFKLTWADVDFEDRLVSLRATTTKTQRSRMIGITDRLFEELRLLYEKSTQDESSLVFGITDTIKTAFAAACREANIRDFRFHDCRHTAITRMVQSGMAPHLIMKVSGHTQPVTFSRYVNADEHTARQAATALDRFNQDALAQIAPVSI